VENYQINKKNEKKIMKNLEENIEKLGQDYKMLLEKIQKNTSNMTKTSV